MSVGRGPRGFGAIYEDRSRTIVIDRKGKLGHPWVGLIDDGVTAGGKRRRRKVTGKSQTEVARKLDAIRKQIAEGGSRDDRAMTVADIAEAWLTKRAPARRSPASMERLTRRVHDHIIGGALGARRVDDLRVDDVEDWLTALAATSARSTLLTYRSDLRRIIQWHNGRRVGGARLNVADAAEVPLTARPTRSKRSLTEAELAALYEALEGDRLASYFTVLVELGLRPQEADALAWSDVDLEAGTLLVQRAMKRGDDGKPLDIGPTKTEGSTRRLALTVQARDALVSRGIAQVAEREAAETVGVWSKDPEWAGLVFCSERGTPMNPSNVRRSFAKAVKRAGIEHVSVYELRHTSASLLIDAGAPIYAVADQLGHASTRMLDKHYRHKVAEVVDTAVRFAAARGFGATCGDQPTGDLAPASAERGAHGL